MEGTFAPASGSDYDKNGICLLYAPYSCTATYASYLANGGTGAASYPVCSADIQTVLGGLVDAGAFSSDASMIWIDSLHSCIS